VPFVNLHTITPGHGLSREKDLAKTERSPTSKREHISSHMDRDMAWGSCICDLRRHEKAEYWHVANGSCCIRVIWRGFQQK
jgi:hypothetical protein